MLDKSKRAKYDEWRLGGFSVVLTFDKWMELLPRVHTVSDLHCCVCVCVGT